MANNFFNDGTTDYNDAVANIEDLIETELQAISVANGFLTDAGQSVEYGRVRYCPDTDVFPALSYHALEGVFDDTGGNQPSSERISLSIEAHLQLKGNPSRDIDNLRRDIIRAVKCARHPQLGRIRVAGWSRIDRLIGSTIVSLEVEFELTIRRGCLNG